MLYCAVGSCIGLAGFILGPSKEIASAALWFSGLCFGPVFPSTLASVGICYKKYVGTIFSIIIATGVLGAVVLTPAVGKIGGSLSNGLRLILIAGFLMLAAQIIVDIRVRKRLSK